MEYVLPGFYTSIQLIALLGLGFFIRRTNLVDSAFQKSVSGFLIKAALPLYFFTTMARADISFLRESLYMPVAAVINVIAALAFSYAVFSIIALPEGEKRAGIALASFGNSGYIPVSLLEILPVTMPLFSGIHGGDKAVVLIGIYLFVYSPVLWSLGNYYISRQRSALSVRKLLTPPLYGILIGLLVPVFRLGPIIFNQELPFFYVFKALEKIGTVVAPLILVTLGAMIAGIKLHSSVKKQMNMVLFGTVLVRYLLLPLFFFSAYFLFLGPTGVDRVLLFVLFLEFHIPPANNFSTMALDSGVNEDVTAYVLLVTYAAYVVLLPVYLFIFSKASGFAM